MKIPEQIAGEGRREVTQRSSVGFAATDSSRFSWSWEDFIAGGGGDHRGFLASWALVSKWKWQR
ncbi:hypothetical protein PAHAL_4G056000 [Panicum hallii]|uniref:Uncharacterized protein n=1 Tax=Panicum hallii TaxID=206008 RepID=A0A2T8JBY1_9POAL|nr:hypothetical protein PAHAL_4G056000 [Panicum hallii]